MAANTLVQARIEEKTRDEAAAVLKDMGLTVSDAVRLLLVRIAREKTMPFDIRLPNRASREAMAELDSGQGSRFGSVEALMADLRADD